jgi:hypothetical protein
MLDRLSSRGTAWRRLQRVEGEAISADIDDLDAEWTGEFLVTIVRFEVEYGERETRLFLGHLQRFI